MKMVAPSLAWGVVICRRERGPRVEGIGDLWDTWVWVLGSHAGRLEEVY